MKFYIIIKDGKSKTYDHRVFLNKSGLAFKKTGRYKGAWFMITEDQNILQELKFYCKSNKLTFINYDQSLKRSTNYREVFYDNNTPLFNKYYICTYCLLPHRKSNITVDHIISIKKARSSKVAKWIMRQMNIENINDQKNLVASCKSCNSIKGSKGGLWIVRGFLAKSKVFIACCYIIFLVWILIIIMLMNEVIK